MEREFLHGLVKFTRKPAKTGPEYVFVIPRSFVKNGLIDPKKTYEIHLKEVPTQKDPDENESKDP